MAPRVRDSSKARVTGGSFFYSLFRVHGFSGQTPGFYTALSVTSTTAVVDRINGGGGLMPKPQTDHGGLDWLGTCQGGVDCFPGGGSLAGADLAHISACH